MCICVCISLCYNPSTYGPDCYKGQQSDTLALQYPWQPLRCTLISFHTVSLLISLSLPHSLHTSPSREEPTHSLSLSLVSFFHGGANLSFTLSVSLPSLSTSGADPLSLPPFSREDPTISRSLSPSPISFLQSEADCLPFSPT